MSRLLAIVVVLIACLTASSQSFSGEIIYLRKIIPKNRKLNVDSIIGKTGNTMAYQVTDGYYRNVYYYNGKKTTSQTYDADSKKLYFEVGAGTLEGEPVSSWYYFSVAFKQ